MEEDDGAAAAAIASLWDGRWIVNDKRKGFVVSVGVFFFVMWRYFHFSYRK